MQRTSVAVDETESTRLRLTFMALMVVSLFVLLFARLWYLQVMAGNEYASLAHGNAVRSVSLEAPRGRILDRDGEVIVDNRFAYVIGVLASELPDDEEQREAVLGDLADLLEITPEELDRRIKDPRVSPLRPRPVAVDVPEELVLYIWENQSTRFPGVYAELLPQRVYPHGDLAGHVLGFLAEIGPKDLESERYEGYRAGELIGMAGVERAYQDELRGSHGLRRLEVNPRGDVVRQLDEVLPTPGADLRLTLSLDVQRAAENALRLGIKEARETEDDREIAPTLEAPGGAVVVLDADTGEVHAMASYPTYEPEQFVGGVSQGYFDQLQDPDNHNPMLNRAIQQSYSPGSVWKVVSASAALEEGFASPTSTLPCPAKWEWSGSVFRNWKERDSGNITMAQSLVESCNTVYYELARRMWGAEEASGGDREIISEMGRHWGFGSPTGIDLSGERGGVVPGRQWKREFWEAMREENCALAANAEEGTGEHDLYTELCSEQGARWRGGDAVNMSTGQGDVQTTPLQVANAYAAIANGGTLFEPNIGHEIHHRDGSVEEIEPEVRRDLGLAKETLGVLHDGLEGVTAPGGTAGGVFGDMPARIAGKTGTAEAGKTRQPYAWFAGYNVEKHEGRRYAVAVAVERGGGGSQTAAPIARRVFETLLDLSVTDVEAGEATD